MIFRIRFARDSRFRLEISVDSIGQERMERVGKCGLGSFVHALVGFLFNSPSGAENATVGMHYSKRAQLVSEWATSARAPTSLLFAYIDLNWPEHTTTQTSSCEPVKIAPRNRLHLSARTSQFTNRIFPPNNSPLLPFFPFNVGWNWAHFHFKLLLCPPP